jgi:pimeloyl-ACP methyl ester carboxylesterase
VRRRTALTAVALAAAATVAARRRAAAHGVDNPVPETTPAPPPPLVGRERTVRTEDGVTLHVEEHGPQDAAATVVLAHGYTQASSLWAGQVRDLLAARDDLKVVVYDHRGHGRSGRTQQEAATLEQLGRDLAAVVEVSAPTGPLLLGGHSMGGMTLMAYAEQHPDVVAGRVAGVAFVGTSSGGLSSVSWGLPRPVAPVFKKLLPRLNEAAWKAEQKGRPRKQVAFFESFVNFGKGAEPADVHAVLEVQAACTAETLHFFLATFDDHDRVQALDALAHVPAVVLVGETDRLCPVAHSRTLAAALPASKLVVYPGAGHMVHLERRPEVSRQLVRLVERALDVQPALRRAAG